ncbi:NADH-quinone oxidoreductase subunit J [Caldinitratiruptor microaerophilus]|nr:NADH-quinone oxidoreductase subunit J [Caldinitratiruptor microaerophilus]
MEYASFGALALVTLVSVYKMITTRLITHAALWMALSFTAVSGVFLMLQQEFVAALQLLIYTGAITTMVIFAIMLSEIREVKVVGAGASWWRRSALLALVVGLLFASFMLYLYYGARLPGAQAGTVPLTVRQIGAELFTRFTVPFELASVLLLLAMIGAIILTAKEAE